LFTLAADTLPIKRFASQLFKTLNNQPSVRTIFPFAAADTEKLKSMPFQTMQISSAFTDEIYVIAFSLKGSDEALSHMEPEDCIAAKSFLLTAP